MQPSQSELQQIEETINKLRDQFVELGAAVGQTGFQFSEVWHSIASEWQPILDDWRDIYENWLWEQREPTWHEILTKMFSGYGEIRLYWRELVLMLDLIGVALIVGILS